MIADNDPTVLELLRTDLTLEGYRVLATARDGVAAIEACQRFRPDILIVDYRMPPGPDGMATIAQIRAAGTADGIVLYTNYRSPTLEGQARRLGVRLVAKGPLRTLREVLTQLSA